VDQPAQKLLSGLFDDLALPRRQFDGSMMFPTDAMLWEQANPMLRIHRDLYAPAVAARESVRPLPREDRFHRLCAFLHDARILGVRKDSEAPETGPLSGRQASITEVQAKEV
jgi:hypothetical protein